jgi:hypothetical protein
MSQAVIRARAVPGVRARRRREVRRLERAPEAARVRLEQARPVEPREMAALPEGQRVELPEQAARPAALLGREREALEARAGARELAGSAGPAEEREAAGAAELVVFRIPAAPSGSPPKMVGRPAARTAKSSRLRRLLN